MTIEEKKLEGYITLKEASELFGYSPDYIGQLIRKGKVEGKQVYANVAWMTTKDSLDEYLSRERGAAQVVEKVPFHERTMRFLLRDDTVRVAKWLLAALIPILAVFAMFVFYFISISIDRKLTLDAQHRLDMKTITANVSESNSSAEYFSYEK